MKIIITLILALLLLCIPRLSSAQHWTYPGTIDQHLQRDHKANIAGLSREQMLDLHDALHEGRVPSQSSRPAQNTKRVRIIARLFNR